MEGVEVVCEVADGEVLSISDPRLHFCGWPVGLTLSAHVVEVAPSVVRVLLVQHHLCTPTDDERDQMRRLWREAAAQARHTWGAVDIESKQGACDDAARSVDVFRMDATDEPTKESSQED